MCGEYECQLSDSDDFICCDFSSLTDGRTHIHTQARARWSAREQQQELTPWTRTVVCVTILHSIDLRRIRQMFEWKIIFREIQSRMYVSEYVDTNSVSVGAFWMRMGQHSSGDDITYV